MGDMFGLSKSDNKDIEKALDEVFGKNISKKDLEL